MKHIEIIAQIIGIIAMLCNILSYQGKKQKMIILLQLFGGILFAVNFLLLGATVGGILNIIAAFRAIVYLYKDKFRADKIIWLVMFSLSYITVYVLNFTLLGKEPNLFNLVIEFLPIIGMLAINIGFMLKKASDVRKCALVGSPAWLIYNISAGSIGAIICEAFSLVSIFVGILRHDRKS